MSCRQRGLTAFAARMRPASGYLSSTDDALWERVDLPAAVRGRRRYELLFFLFSAARDPRRRDDALTGMPIIDRGVTA